MKTSTEIASLSKKVGERKAVELYGKAGFDAWDFSLFEMARWDWDKHAITDTPHPLKSSEYLAFARELKRIGEDYGMVCNQSHAPFPVRYMSDDILKRAIECTAEAGGSICIIHPDNDATAEQNAEMYQRLLPFAKEHGVKIATENMWNWYKGEPTSAPAACSTIDSFVKHIDVVNDPYFVACLDLGHAEMRGSGDGAPEMIRALGHRLQALHIHDNDRLHDSHQIPFSMDMDFGAIVDALKEIGYSGYLTLEADRYLSAYNADNVFDGVKNLYESVTKLKNMF
jgi:sugar phosphate isomerase/epimerase